eukprot:6578710-Heterocapsa_arctica.AAC.1
MSEWGGVGQLPPASVSQLIRQLRVKRGLARLQNFVGSKRRRAAETCATMLSELWRRTGFVCGVRLQW